MNNTPEATIFTKLHSLSELVEILIGECEQRNLPVVTLRHEFEMRKRIGGGLREFADAALYTLNSFGHNTFEDHGVILIYPEGTCNAA